MTIEAVTVHIYQIMGPNKEKNKALYTTASVAYRWAGAVTEV